MWSPVKCWIFGGVYPPWNQHRTWKLKVGLLSFGKAYFQGYGKYKWQFEKQQPWGLPQFSKALEQQLSYYTHRQNCKPKRKTPGIWNMNIWTGWKRRCKLRISFGHHVQILSLDIQMPPLGCGVFKVCFPKLHPDPQNELKVHCYVWGLVVWDAPLSNNPFHTRIPITPPKTNMIMENPPYWRCISYYWTCGIFRLVNC